MTSVVDSTPWRVHQTTDIGSEKLGLVEALQEDIAELQGTDELPDAKEMRERTQWATDDARTAKLKERGNDAFKRGEYRTAWIVYAACVRRAPDEEVYYLNRAAAALKLGLYTVVPEDAIAASRDKKYAAKAAFRASHAYRAVGRWDDARRALDSVLLHSPGDESVSAERAELERIAALPEDQRDAWLTSQNPRSFRDYFSSAEELSQLVQEQVDLAESLAVTNEEIWAAMV